MPYLNKIFLFLRNSTNFINLDVTSGISKTSKTADLTAYSV